VTNPRSQLQLTSQEKENYPLLSAKCQGAANKPNAAFKVFLKRITSATELYSEFEAEAQKLVEFTLNNNVPMMLTAISERTIQ
jgi:hypothetical protein